MATRTDKISGKDWRWDKAKGKWVRSYGTDPGAAITRPYKKFVKSVKTKIKAGSDIRRSKIIGKGTANNPEFKVDSRGNLKRNPNFKPKKIQINDQENVTPSNKKTNDQLKVNPNKGNNNNQGKSSKKFVNKVGGDPPKSETGTAETPTPKSNTITHPNYKPRKPKSVYDHHRGTQAKIGTGESPLRNRGPIQTQRATFAPGERDFRGRLIKDIKGLNPETGMIDRAPIKALGLEIPQQSISVTPEYLGGRNFSNVKTLGQAYQLKGTSPMFTKGIVGNALDLRIMKLSQQQAQAQAAAAKLKESVQSQGGDQPQGGEQPKGGDQPQGGVTQPQAQVANNNVVPPTNTVVPAFNYQNLVQQPWAQQAFNPASQGLAISGVGAAPLNIAPMPPPVAFTPPPVLPPMAFPTTGLSIMGAGAGGA